MIRRHQTIGDRPGIVERMAAPDRNAQRQPLVEVHLRLRVHAYGNAHLRTCAPAHLDDAANVSAGDASIARLEAIAPT